MRLLSVALVGLTLLAGCSTGRDVYNRSGGSGTYSRSYPASARTTQRGQERYRVCHNGRNSLTLPTSAVDAHIRHGDSFGTCSARRNDRRDDRQDNRREDRREDRRETRGNGHGNGHGRNGH